MENSSKKYRDEECSNCGEFKVLLNGVCEECGWDEDQSDYYYPNYGYNEIDEEEDE